MSEDKGTKWDSKNGRCNPYKIPTFEPSNNETTMACIRRRVTLTNQATKLIFIGGMTLD